MMKALWKGLALTVLLTSTAMASKTPVNASVSISIQALQQKVQVTAEGKRKVKWVKPDTVIPGDEVVYAITYKNRGRVPSDQVVITNVIPEHMRLRAGSARSNKAKVSFSVDGGRSFKKPEALKVRAADGRLRAASSMDYTHIQWEILNPVAPGAHGVVSYRAILD